MIGETLLKTKYKECISNMGCHFNHPHFYLGLVAYCLLFHTNDKMVLYERKRINKIFEEAERLIQVGSHDIREDIGKVLVILMYQNVFFSDHQKVHFFDSNFVYGQSKDYVENCGLIC